MGERERDGGRERERERERERCVDYTNKQRGKNKGATCEVCVLRATFLNDVCSEAAITGNSTHSHLEEVHDKL